MSANRYELLKKNCIDQVNRFFKFNVELSEKIIQIINLEFDSQIEFIFQISDTIRAKKHARTNNKTSSLFFSHILVFSYENSKMYSNAITDVLNYATSFEYIYNNDEQNYLIRPNTSKYCVDFGKQLKYFNLSKEFDTNPYKFYANIPNHNITIQRQDDEITRLRQENKILISELRQKNSQIQYIEDNFAKIKNDYKIVYDKYLYYKSELEKLETQYQTNSNGKRTKTDGYRYMELTGSEYTQYQPGYIQRPIQTDYSQHQYQSEYYEQKRIQEPRLHYSR